MVLSKAEKEQKEKDRQPHGGGVADPAEAHTSGAVPMAEEEAGQGGDGVCMEGLS